MRRRPWYRRPWTLWSVVNGTGVVLLLASCAAGVASDDYTGAVSLFFIGALVLPVTSIAAASWSHLQRTRRRARARRRDHLTIPQAPAGPTSTAWPTEASQQALTVKARQPRFELHGDGSPGVQTQGEFARTDALVAAIGHRPGRDEEVVLPAMEAALIPDIGNPHDRHAVAVVIDGHHVSYLARADAAIYEPVLTRIVDAGYTPTTTARIWAVERVDREGRPSIKANVRVALGAPDAILPTNEPPRRAHSMLPWGRGLQVTGEEHHLEHLSRHIHVGERRTIGTLHLTTVRASERSQPKTIVEVRIDGDVVGGLTAAMSEHFAPTIRHLEQQGLVTAVWLRVKASPIAAQVTMHAPKAHEIPAAWFERPHPVPALRRHDRSRPTGRESTIAAATENEEGPDCP